MKTLILFVFMTWRIFTDPTKRLHEYIIDPWKFKEYIAFFILFHPEIEEIWHPNIHPKYLGVIDCAYMEMMRETECPKDAADRATWLYVNQRYAIELMIDWQNPQPLLINALMCLDSRYNGRCWYRNRNW